MMIRSGSGVTPAIIAADTHLSCGWQASERYQLAESFGSSRGTSVVTRDPWPYSAPFSTKECLGTVWKEPKICAAESMDQKQLCRVLRAASDCDASACSRYLRRAKDDRGRCPADRSALSAGSSPSPAHPPFAPRTEVVAVMFIKNLVSPFSTYSPTKSG